jgi:hypothetical protein
MASSQLRLIPVGNLVIANGAAISNSIEGESISEEFGSFVFVAPATITDATGVDIEVSADDSAWTKYQDPPGTTITLAQATSIAFTDLPFPYFRVKTNGGGNEAAERTIQVFGRRK